MYYMFSFKLFASIKTKKEHTEMKIFWILPISKNFILNSYKIHTHCVLNTILFRGSGTCSKLGVQLLNWVQKLIGQNLPLPNLGLKYWVYKCTPLGIRFHHPCCFFLKIRLDMLFSPILPGKTIKELEKCWLHAEYMVST